MAFATFLRQRGAPVDRYLRRHGLPVYCDDSDAFIPLLRIWSFFNTTAHNQDLDLGWHVGAHVGDHQLNAGLLRKLESAPTLLQALRRLKLMVSGEATALQINIEERRDDILLCTHYPGLGEEPGYDISQAYQIGIFLDLIRHFLGRQWVPDEIGIETTHIPPGAEECFPDSRILMQQPAGYIAVPRSFLHWHPPFADEKVGGTENPLLDDKPPVLSANFDYLRILHAVIKPYLSEGYVSARVAAELMNTSARTLTRRLSIYGLTYGVLIDGMRFNAAKKLLRSTDMRIGDVGHSVGFKDQGDFTRMFHRVGGLSPNEFRNTTKH